MIALIHVMNSCRMLCQLLELHHQKSQGFELFFIQSVTPIDCWITKMRVLGSVGSPRRRVGHTAQMLLNMPQEVVSREITLPLS